MQKKYRKDLKNTEEPKKSKKAAVIMIAAAAVLVIALSILLAIQLSEPSAPPSAEITPPVCTDKTDYTLGKFTYKVLDDGSAMITSCSLDRSVTELFIPSEMDGKPVTAIDNSAFEIMTWLTAVDIPEGVTYIGKNAFAFCGMTSVNLPSTLKAIQIDAFNGCEYIKLSSYNGTREEWKKVTVVSGNTTLTRQITFLKNS